MSVIYLRLVIIAAAASLLAVAPAPAADIAAQRHFVQQAYN